MARRVALQGGLCSQVGRRVTSSHTCAVSCAFCLLGVGRGRGLCREGSCRGGGVGRDLWQLLAGAALRFGARGSPAACSSGVGGGRRCGVCVPGCPPCPRPASRPSGAALRSAPPTALPDTPPPRPPGCATCVSCGHGPHAPWGPPRRSSSAAGASARPAAARPGGGRASGSPLVLSTLTCGRRWRRWPAGPGGPCGCAREGPFSQARTRSDTGHVWGRLCCHTVVPLALSRWGPGMLLRTPQCPGRHTEFQGLGVHSAGGRGQGVPCRRPQPGTAPVVCSEGPAGTPLRGHGVCTDPHSLLPRDSGVWGKGQRERLGGQCGVVWGNCHR